jgi:eukaryotic-like serine/threonine-protein kinase
MGTRTAAGTRMGIFTAMSEEFRLVAGRYRLHERLGQGGMGAVWRATDQFLERIVALKEVLLPASLDESDPVFQRTLREARASARLKHPGIVTLHDVVVEDGRPWIVMELVGGQSLLDVVRRDGPLREDRAVALARQLLAALGAAHAQAILHRDVKPANVLLDGDRAVLTDFGIAAIAGAPTLTAANQLIGSPLYIAPERITGQAAGPPSDLWALGVTLFFAVTGTEPFAREDAQAVLAAVLVQDPPAVPGPLGPVIGGLLRRDPVERLTVAGATAHLPPEPTPTHPVTPPPRPVVPRPPRRHAPVAIATVVVVALVAAIVWMARSDRIAGEAVAADDPATTSEPTPAPAADVTVPGSPTFERMTERGAVVVGVRDDQPGLGYRDPNGTFSGFDIEIARMVAAGLGFAEDQVTFVPVTAVDRESRLTAGTVDMVVATYQITEQRKQLVGFAGPYLTGGQDLLVRRDDPSITGPETLSGHRVCTVAGSVSATVLEERSTVAPADIVLRDTYPACLDQLLAEHVDAVTSDDVLLRGYVSADPQRLRMVGRPFTEVEYGIGLAHADKPLRDKVNDILTTALSDGAWQAGYDRTLGAAGVPPVLPTVKPY